LVAVSKLLAASSNELKLKKKSLIKRNAKAKIELLKSDQSETELWKEE
jgi:hypothetical protein